MCELREERDLFDGMNDSSLEMLMSIDSDRYFCLRAKDYIHPEISLEILGGNIEKVIRCDKYKKKDTVKYIKPLNNTWEWGLWWLEIKFKDKALFEYVIRKYTPSIIIKGYDVDRLEDCFTAYFGNMLPILRQYGNIDIKYYDNTKAMQDNKFSAFQNRVFIEESRVGEMIKRAKEAA